MPSPSYYPQDPSGADIEETARRSHLRTTKDSAWTLEGEAAQGDQSPLDDPAAFRPDPDEPER